MGKRWKKGLWIYEERNCSTLWKRSCYIYSLSYKTFWKILYFVIYTCLSVWAHVHVCRCPGGTGAGVTDVWGPTCMGAGNGGQVLLEEQKSCQAMASALQSTFRSKNNQIVTGPHISPYLFNLSTRGPLWFLSCVWEKLGSLQDGTPHVALTGGGCCGRQVSYKDIRLQYPAGKHIFSQNRVCTLVHNFFLPAAGFDRGSSTVSP